MGLVEAIFTDETECKDGWHVVLPSHAICQCDHVTLKQVPHSVYPIRFRIDPTGAVRSPFPFCRCGGKSRSRRDDGIWRCDGCDAAVVLRYCREFERGVERGTLSDRQPTSL